MEEWGGDAGTYLNGGVGGDAGGGGGSKALKYFVQCSGSGLKGQKINNYLLKIKFLAKIIQLETEERYFIIV